MKIDGTTPAAPRETTTRSASGSLIYCRDLFEKDLYRQHMPQVRGEEVQLATPLHPSPEAVKTAAPVTTRKQRGTTARP